MSSRALELSCYPGFGDDPLAHMAQGRARWLTTRLLRQGGTLRFSGHRHALAEDDHLADEIRDHPGFLHSEESPLALAQASDHVLVWSQEALRGAPAWLQRKAILDDPYTDPGNPATVMERISALTPPAQNAADAELNALVERARGERLTPHIFGSGPENPDQVARHFGSLPERPFSIIMATAIGSEALPADLAVDICIAWDAAAQLGPSQTAQRCRSRIHELQRRHGTRVIYPAKFDGFVRAFWPADLRDKLIPLDTGNPPGLGLAPGGSLAFVHSRNVLTSVALPLASAVHATRIIAIGVTIERADVLETGTHWRHANEVAYQREIAPMLATHPAFGTTNSSGYIEEHFKVLEDQVSRLHDIGQSLCGIDGSPAPVRVAGPRPTWHRSKSWVDALVGRAIASLDQIELRTGLASVIVFGFSAIVVAGGLQVTTSETLLTILVAINLVGFFLGFIYLRSRSSRSLLRVHGELSRQIARMFENLSTRVEALEHRSSEKNDV